MSLDQRQTQIQEGAGLTESRLNQEFVDLLRKYSTPVLLVICIVALAYVGWNKYSAYRQGTVDAAWSGLQEAIESRSPEGLLAIAEEHAGEPGVPLIARTAAADILLQYAIMGLAPGAVVKPDGAVDRAEDLLTTEQKDRQLERAAAEYQRVVDAVGKNDALVLHKITALFGLAAVAETRNQFDAAKGHYEQISALAQNADMPGLVAAAKKLLETSEQARNAPRLFADAAVVTRPVPPPAPPIATPAPITPTLIPDGPLAIEPVPSPPPPTGAVDPNKPTDKPGTAPDQPAPSPEKPADAPKDR